MEEHLLSHNLAASANGKPQSEQEFLLVYETFMREYTALKSEQVARIGFRDNLLYVQLTAVGAVFAFATQKDSYIGSLLVIPWISIILGWTYIVNDHHISRLGKYSREVLSRRMRGIFPCLPVTIFGWEVFHRSDGFSLQGTESKLASRLVRKRMQFLVDWIAFVASSIVALALFWDKQLKLGDFELGLVVIDSSMLLILTVFLWIYSDFAIDTELD
jgi:hypothetical protein